MPKLYSSAALRSKRENLARTPYVIHGTGSWGKVPGAGNDGGRSWSRADDEANEVMDEAGADECGRGFGGDMRRRRIERAFCHGAAT